MNNHGELLDRIMGNAAIEPGGCLISRYRSLNTNGYPQMRLSGRTRKASRIVFEAATRTDPSGLWVLHRCDNRRCVNPSHLFLGTAKDNALDMIEKGRDTKLSKLTVAQVASIRSERNLPQAELAHKYGVSQSTVSRVTRGRTWRNV